MIHESMQEQTLLTPAAKAERLDRLLDEALAETFPASDPVAICSDDQAPGRGPEAVNVLANPLVIRARE